MAQEMLSIFRNDFLASTIPSTPKGVTPFGGTPNVDSIPREIMFTMDDAWPDHFTPTRARASATMSLMISSNPFFGAQPAARALAVSMNFSGASVK